MTTKLEIHASADMRKTSQIALDRLSNIFNINITGINDCISNYGNKFFCDFQTDIRNLCDSIDILDIPAVNDVAHPTPST